MPRHFVITECDNDKMLRNNVILSTGPRPGIEYIQAPFAGHLKPGGTPMGESPVTKSFPGFARNRGIENC